jgi:hemoglobin
MRTLSLLGLSTVALLMSINIAMAEPASLYQRLGGQPAIHAVVNDFIGNVAADTRINRFFAKTDIPHLKNMLEQQLCAATGGPCVYQGRDMKTTHSGMNVTEADFNYLVADLVMSLDKFKVPATEKGELLGALGGMKNDIVSKATPHMD